jgi:hypothetical protein
MPDAEDIPLVDLGDSRGVSLETPAPPRVYLRAHWAEAWELIPYLHAIEVVWSTAPTLPVAVLQWRYGEIKQHDDRDFFVEFKLAGKTRAFVKIECDTIRDPEDVTLWLSRTWYGVLEIESDDSFGARVDRRESPLGPSFTNIASGRQEFTCYGLEKLLMDHAITGTKWPPADFDAEDPFYETNFVPAVFNRGGVGNRTTIEYGEAPHLHPLFATDVENASKWSSDAIIRYLLATQTPLDRLGAVLVPFAFATDGIVPTWDAPELEADGQTTYSLLDRLINRRRLLTWWIEVDEDTGDEPHLANVLAATLTPSEIPNNVPGAVPIPANGSPKVVGGDYSQVTSISIKASDVGQYDQVIVRGRRRVSVATFAVNDALEKGWDLNAKGEYDAGASDSAGYSDLDVDEKVKRDAAVRSHPKLRKVYSFFRLPVDWDLKVQDAAGEDRPVFEKSLGGDEPQAQYYPELFFERGLPLFEEVNYTGGIIAAKSYYESEERPFRELLGPLVFARRPASGKWAAGEEFSVEAEITDADDNPQFSLSVDVPPDSHGVYVRVQGEPQHAIATDDFVALDTDPEVGAFDYAEHLRLTLALQEGRYFEARWPPSEPPGDALRQKVLYVGEQYEKIHVVPDTVLGVDVDGELKRSEGGDIIRPRDGDKRLLAIARVAAAWYCRTHYDVVIQTQLLGASLHLGDMITEIRPVAAGDVWLADGHYRVVNAPISQLAISYSAGEGASSLPPPPILTIETMSGELDPIQTIPPSLPPVVVRRRL